MLRGDPDRMCDDDGDSVIVIIKAEFIRNAMTSVFIGAFCNKLLHDTHILKTQDLRLLDINE